LRNANYSNQPKSYEVEGSGLTRATGKFALEFHWNYVRIKLTKERVKGIVNGGGTALIVSIAADILATPETAGLSLGLAVVNGCIVGIIMATITWNNQKWSLF
jgi:hypothetical protein